MTSSVRSSLLRLTALAICFVLFAESAAAWGPRARRAIAAAAVSQAPGEFGRVFNLGHNNYEADVIRGAAEGFEAIESMASLRTEREAIDAVMNEIDLLAAVRTRGVGSYFAYRMGALSALVSQIVVPYGFATTPEAEELYAKITADLERHVEQYGYNPYKTPVTLIENPRRYFASKRPFLQDDLTLIREEYARGRGYTGFLKNAGPAYFQRSVEAVMDAWNTVMRGGSSAYRRKPPAGKLAQYYIDEIRFHLEVKKNVDSADRAYRDFAEVNPGDMRNYIRVGDLYYAYGTPEAKERAVHEWKIAYKEPGLHAREAARRISAHYLTIGDNMFERSKTPEALDTDLEDARRAYQTALEFDGTSQRAATSISEVTSAINRRRELYDQQQAFIDSALQIRENAERSLVNENYSDALSSFQQALNLAETVGPEFPDLQEQAKELASDLRKNIKIAITDMFDMANDRIQEGDAEMTAGNPQDALNIYRTVEALMAQLPEEEDSIDTQRKLDMLDLVAGKIEDAEIRLKNQQAVGGVGS